MTETEKAIRDFCGHRADWWPSASQVQAMLALAQDQFKPDWDAMAVMVEEQQRMAMRIEDLAAILERQTPPQRTWVGLTNDEVNNFAAGCHLGNSVQGAIYKAEAKLKEKNT